MHVSADNSVVKDGSFVAMLRRSQRGDGSIRTTVAVMMSTARPGKYQLPGGVVDPEDASLEDAAIRELWEELRQPLDPRQLTPLGSTPSDTTGGELTCFLADLKETPAEYVCDPEEVASVLEVDVQDLVKLPALPGSRRMFAMVAERVCA